MKRGAKAKASPKAEASPKAKAAGKAKAPAAAAEAHGGSGSGPAMAGGLSGLASLQPPWDTLLLAVLAAGL